MATHSSVLAGELHGCSLAGYDPWGRKESDMTEQLTHTQSKNTASNQVLHEYLTREFM